MRALDPAEVTVAGLREAATRLQAGPRCRPLGVLLSIHGASAEVRLPGARLGMRCAIGLPGSEASGSLRGEVVALEADRATLLLEGSAAGIATGTPVAVTGETVSAAGPALLGRVIDPLGRPLDGGPSLDPRGLRPVALDPDPPAAHQRRPITEPLWTGVRAIDALCTLGRGQRVGLIAPPGTGKTRLIHQLAIGAEVEVVVVALVGERGRELQEWIDSLPEQLGSRVVTVAATSDAPAQLRVRAAPMATAVAEHFRAQGKEVLLLVDSLTRHLRAQREVALIAGERPGPTGYPASVLASLPRLLERAGNDERGRMSAVYTILSETARGQPGMEEELRGLLDGHLVLSRTLAERGHFPALDPGESLSRLADRITEAEHRAAATRMRAWAQAYEERRELLVLGAWEPGRDAEGDEALARWPAVEALLRQAGSEPCPPDQLREALRAVVP